MPTTPSPLTAVAAGVSDYLVLRVSADSWQGDPKFTVRVDGKPIGGTLVATASHAKGQTQDVLLTGPFAAGAHRVEVLFDDDACGWAPGKDRNLYVHQVAFTAPSIVAPGGVMPLLSNGTSAVFETAGPAPSPAVSAAPTSPTEDLPMTVKFLGGSGASVANFGPAADGKTFKGRAPAGASVTVTDGTQTGTVTASAAGIWSFVFGTAPTADVTASAVISALFKGIGGGTPPVVTPPAASGLVIGTYVDNRSGAAQDFVNWIGKTPNGFFAEPHGPGNAENGGEDIDSPSGWDYNLGVSGWNGPGKICNVQVVPIQKRSGKTLAQAAAGNFNTQYYNAAKEIIKFKKAKLPTQTRIIARIGQEPNGQYGSPTVPHPDWLWQYIRNNAVDPVLAGQYKQMFRNAVAQFRQAAIDEGLPGLFEFDFCVNLGSWGWDLAYPGDDVVDHFGMDGYQGLDGYGDNPFRLDGYEIFEHMRTIPFGFQDGKNFADARGKPFRIDEFGVRRNDLPTLVTAALKWADINCSSIALWDSAGAYDSRFSNGNLAVTWSALRTFVNPSAYPAPLSPPIGTNLIPQPIPDLAAGWRSTNPTQDLVITKNYGLAPDGVTPTTRIRSASGGANLEYVLSHADARQVMNLRALIPCTLTQFSPARGGEKVYLKVGEARQIIKDLGSNTQFNLYSEDGAYDYEIWGAGVYVP